MFQTRDHQDSSRSIRRSRFAAAIGLVLSLLTLSGVAGADTTRGSERLSPRGIKGSFGLGMINLSSPSELDNGSSGSLRIGWGIDDQFTIWGTIVGSEHSGTKDAEGRRTMSDVGGTELSLQYALCTSNRLQPYGRVGLGSYALRDRRSHDILLGSGMVFGVGADYFFARNWGIGAEAIYRAMDYTQGQTSKEGDLRKLRDPIDGDAAGFMVSLTVQ